MQTQSLIAQLDTGEWTCLDQLLELLKKSAEALESVVSLQTERGWQRQIVTTEFARKTLAEPLEGLFRMQPIRASNWVDTSRVCYHE